MTYQKKCIDVICVTEHFMKSGHEANLTCSNYNLATFYCRSERRGGSCILVRKGHAFKELSEFKNMSIKSVFECCSVEIIPYNIIIVCTYRTPN